MLCMIVVFVQYETMQLVGQCRTTNWKSCEHCDFYNWKQLKRSGINAGKLLFSCPKGHQ